MKLIEKARQFVKSMGTNLAGLPGPSQEELKLIQEKAAQQHRQELCNKLKISPGALLYRPNVFNPTVTEIKLDKMLNLLEEIANKSKEEK